MSEKCAICGREFDVLYPDIYRYRRGKRWFCRYTCMRAYDTKNERGSKPMDNSVKKRDQLEVLMGLVEAAQEGKTPDEYLISIGYRKPREKYYYIRRWAKENQPELFEALPKRQEVKRGPKPKSDKVRVLNGTEYEKAEPEEPVTLGDAMEEMKAAADGFFDQCRDMGLNIPDTEAPDPADRDFDDRTTVSAIRVDGLGEFYYDKKYNSVDWRTDGGDEVSMAPWLWGQLADDLPRILKRLGVDTCSE